MEDTLDDDNFENMESSPTHHSKVEAPTAPPNFKSSYVTTDDSRMFANRRDPGALQDAEDQPDEEREETDEHVTPKQLTLHGKSPSAQPTSQNWLKYNNDQESDSYQRVGEEPYVQSIGDDYSNGGHNHFSSVRKKPLFQQRAMSYIQPPILDCNSDYAAMQCDDAGELRQNLMSQILKKGIELQMKKKRKAIAAENDDYLSKDAGNFFDIEQDGPRKRRNSDCNLAAQEDEEFYQPLSLILIGNTGDGKSTFANGITKGSEGDDGHFKMGSGLTACTQSVQQQILPFHFQKEIELRVVDTPGLNESVDADKKNIVEMMKKFRQNIKYAHLFVVLINSTNRYQQSTRQNLEKYQQNFAGKNKKMFWKHVCVIFTRWSNSPDQIKNRRKQKAFKAKHISKLKMDMEKDFPVLVQEGITIPVFFTDVLDLGETYDSPTVSEMHSIVFLAKSKRVYDCQSLCHVVYSEWREARDSLKELLASNEAQLKNYGKTALSYYRSEIKEIRATVYIDRECMQMDFKWFQAAEKKALQTYQICIQKFLEEKERLHKRRICCITINSFLTILLVVFLGYRYILAHKFLGVKYIHILAQAQKYKDMEQSTDKMQHDLYEAQKRQYEKSCDCRGKFNWGQGEVCGNDLEQCPHGAQYTPQDCADDHICQPEFALPENEHPDVYS